MPFSQIIPPSPSPSESKSPLYTSVSFLLSYIYFFNILELLFSAQRCRDMPSILYVYIYIYTHMGFPGDSVVRNLPANAGDAGDVSSVPGLGRSPGEGNGNPLQYSCLGNPMARGAWWATVQGITKSNGLKWLSTH